MESLVYQAKLFDEGLPEDEPLAPVNYIYFVQSEITESIKIGRASDLENRLSMISTDTPGGINLIAAVQVPPEVCHEVEKTIHGDFVDCRIDASREWFTTDEQTVLDYIEFNDLHEVQTFEGFKIWMLEREIVWWNYINEPTKDHARRASVEVTYHAID